MSTAARSAATRPPTSSAGIHFATANLSGWLTILRNLLPRASVRAVQERGAFHQRPQAQHRPGLAAAPERPAEVMLAADHRRRRLRRELALGEAPESQDLVDHETRRNLAVVDDDHARVPPHRQLAAAEILLQVDHRQERPAHVCEAQAPAPRAGPPG